MITKIRLFLKKTDLLLYAFEIFLGIILCTHFILGFTPTGSMEPTIKTCGFYLCTKRFDRDALDRGDIILFKGEDGKLIVKRVIGLPGETVAFFADVVWIDGVYLDERAYLPEGTPTRSAVPSFVVPEGCYFVLGDNRTVSVDSRIWADPYVSPETIKGKVI